MSQITTKWIEDGAITPVKVDTAGYFFVHGIDATHANFIDATIANMVIGGATFSDATVTNLTVDNQFQTLDATTLNNLVVGGNAQIDGDAAIGGNATVTGDLFISTTGGTGITLIGRNTNDNFIEVNGELFLDTSSSTIHLYQDSTTVQINGDTTVSGGFYGTGNAQIDGDATVTGNFLVSTTGGTGIRLIGRNTNDNFVEVNGDLFLDTASATVHLYQDSTTVQINGDTTVSGGFYGTGNAQIGGDATVGRGLKVRGPMSVTTGTHDATLFGQSLTFDRDSTDYMEVGYANSAINCTRQISNLSILIDTTNTARFWNDHVELNRDASIGNAYFGGRVGINSSLLGTSRLVVADLNGEAIRGWINDGGLGTGILGRAAGEPYVAQSRSMAGVFFGDTSVTKNAYVNGDSSVFGRMTSRDASFGYGGALSYQILNLNNSDWTAGGDVGNYFHVPTTIPISSTILDARFSYDRFPGPSYASLQSRRISMDGETGGGMLRSHCEFGVNGSFFDASVFVSGVTDATYNAVQNKKLFVTYVV